MGGKKGAKGGRGGGAGDAKGGSADKEMQELASLCGFGSSAILKEGGGVRGLYAKKDLSAGDVILSVPFHVCLLAEAEGGVSGAVELPPLKLPWDLRMALALLEVVNGQGGPFWARYCKLLPTPDALSLPFCLPPGKRQELQHKQLEDGAAAQVERLRTLFPEAMPDEGEEWEFPNGLQWAYALVRSRAYNISPGVFGFVPFLDMANHDALANSDFVPDRTQSAIQLRAVREVAAGEELTVSYGAYTNQRWMAQYGFVPGGGANTSDRLVFDTTHMGCGIDVKRLRSASGMSGAELAGDKRALAALASLQELVPGVPLEAPGDEFDAAGAARAAVGRVQAEAAGSSAEQQRAAAEALLDQCAAELAACATGLEDDEALLAGGEGGEGEGGWLRAAVEYRAERKRMLSLVGELVERYVAVLEV